MKKNYDLSALMTLAWEIFRNKAKKCDTFSEALKRAWACFDVGDSNREKVENAKREHGITEEIHTWFVWTLHGRKVMHDEHACFKVLLDTPENGIGKTFLTPYFTYSQTDLAENVA